MPLHASILTNTEALTVITGRRYKADGTRRPAIWLHSAGATVGAEHLEPWLPTNNCLALFELIAETLGMPIAVPRVNGASWGNDTAQTRIGDAISYLRSSRGAHASLPALLMGVSMGGMAALNYWRANPAAAVAAVLFYPATSLQAIHDGTGGAANGAATTEAAYGGSLAAFNATVVAHDPAQNAASHTGKDIRAYYSTADTVLGTANQTAFFNAVGGGGLSTVNLGAVGHADMTALDINNIAAYVASKV